MRSSIDQRPLLLAGIAALLGAALYLNSVQNGFVFDDRPLVERNAQIRSLRNLPEFFRTPYHRYYGDEGADTGHYRPLTIVTFAANYAVGGLRPEGYHLVNVLLHALASALVVLIGLLVPPLVRPCPDPAREGPVEPGEAGALVSAAALAGGLLFAAHPIHTEAVANVAGRAELLATVFFLAALICYMRGKHVLSAAWFALALLSKENALTFLGVAVAWEALLRARQPGWSARNAASSLGWIVLAAAAVLALRAWVLGSPFSPPTDTNPLNNPLMDHGLFTRWLTATAVAARYAWLLVFPMRLSPDYSWAQIVPVTSLADPLFLAGLALTVATAAFLFFSARKSPSTTFFVLLALVPFSLVSNFPVAIATIMGERLLYLPSVGACLLAGCLWPRLDARLGRRAAAAVAVVVLAALSFRTVARNPDWRDGYRLFSKAALTSPRCARVFNNLGAELLKLDRVGEGKEAVERARSIAPDWPSVRINLAQAHLAEGNLSAAESLAREAVRGLPGSPLALMKLGEVLEARGKLGEAAAAYQSGLALEPSDFDARLRLGRVAAGLGDFATAERELTSAVGDRPGSVPARTTLGLYYQSRGQLDRAIEQLGEAARLLPSSLEVKNNLGNALRSAGRFDEAATVLEETLTLDERFAPTHYNLALTREQAGRLDEARRHYVRALEIQPSHDAAQRALGRLALRSGDYETALGYLDQALRNNETSKEGHALRSRVCIELGRYQEAEQDLIRLLELDPGSAAAQENLDRVRALARSGTAPPAK